MMFPRISAACLAGLLAGCITDRAGSDAPAGPKPFPTDVAGLSFATGPQDIPAAAGDTVVLDARPVKKMLKGHEVFMQGYNGSIPGPTLRVRQGDSIIVKVKNHTGFPTSLHAHGVRMDYRFDGASGFSQEAIPDGGSFTYVLKFPDPGLYWYHAHAREDWSQEMGLYGNIRVEPADTSYWKPADREQMLMLDDFWLDSATWTAPFRAEGADHAMMGRFGNLYLINGDTAFSMTVKRGEVVRFFATNSANARSFNIGLAGTDGAYRPLKLIGGDNGAYAWFDKEKNLLIAPGERRIFDAWFDTPGTINLIHHILKSPYNNESTVVLGHITVLDDSIADSHAAGFLAEDSSLTTLRSIDSLRAYLDPKLPPDKELLLTGKMGPMPGMTMKVAAGEPISTEAKGVEWLDHMPTNPLSNTSNMNWIIRDVATGAENHEIFWTFKRGDKVRIRIRNDSTAYHWMPHPVHFHGQRFMVAAVNGIPNLNPAWKDTYLVGMRETVDLLLDASNPGGWMVHCHIAEHAEDMMMFHLRVE